MEGANGVFWWGRLYGFFRPRLHQRWAQPRTSRRLQKPAGGFCGWPPNSRWAGKTWQLL